MVGLLPLPVELQSHSHIHTDKLHRLPCLPSGLSTPTPLPMMEMEVQVDQFLQRKLRITTPLLPSVATQEYLFAPDTHLQVGILKQMAMEQITQLAQGPSLLVHQMQPCLPSGTSTPTPLPMMATEARVEQPLQSRLRTTTQLLPS